MCSNKMNSSKYYESSQKHQYEPYDTKEDGTMARHRTQNISIIIHKKNIKGRKKHRYNTIACAQPNIICNLSHFHRKHIQRHSSMPEIIHTSKLKLSIKTPNAMSYKIVSPSVVKHSAADNSLKYRNALNHRYQPNYTIYRCQVATNVAENCNNCCCSCNSDTMFEVMKDLYECYKNRNCENCNCILCCHLPAEDRFKESGKPCPEINLESALKELAMKGFALPEGKSVSEKELIDTIRNVLGLPPEPMSQEMRDKYTKAANAGIMLPLEGKSMKLKEKILRDLHAMEIPLPVGRTSSEKSLIRKILGKTSQHFQSLTDNIQDAKRSGLLLISYEGKSPDQIEKILKEVAMRGIPLPEPQTPLLKNLIQKVRTDLGLPPEPKNSAMRAKHKEAAAAGLLLPLEGKTEEEKEIILQALDNMKIPLPEGRTPSEKALIAKVRERRKLEEKTASNMIEGEGPVDECICEFLSPRHLALSEKKRKAKAAGLLTPIKGKSKVQKEKILKGLALEGLPLPKGDTVSDAKLIKKVRANLGLPPEPKTLSMRDIYTKAAEDGILIPLEGKSNKDKEKILKALHSRGIPLPKGRTPSEKILVDKILREPREQKARKSVTFLKGKTPREQEKILRDLAMKGKPLPEASTESEKDLLNRVRVDLGLPPEPRSQNMRNKYDKAAEMGLLHPLEGKSIKEKEKILRDLANIGIPLPKSRTASEKALIAKIKGEPRQHRVEAKLGIEGETPEEKENILREMAIKGIAFPKGKTSSETKLLIKVRNDLGLPPEPKSSSVRHKYEIAAENGLLQPLEGRTLEEKENILLGLLHAGIPLPQGRTPSEKSLIVKIQYENMTPSEKIRKAKDAGLLTPLEKKTPSQREHILRRRAMMGMPLPKGETASQTKLIVKIRGDLGLPPEPKQSSMRNRYARAADIGALQPLEGKTTKQKEKIIRQLIDLKMPLPKGRTQSEQAMIDRIQKETSERPKLTPTEKMRAAKAAGLLTPLKGKSPTQKEKILKGLARHGIPLPEGKTKSENDILYKLRLELGLPPEPKTSSLRARYVKATDAGIILPLEGKTPQEKEKILRGLADAGIPLPKARTPSEKALIAKVKGEPHRFPKITASEKMRKAKAAGLLTPLKGKSTAQKEKILRGLVKHGMPLPEGKTESEKDILHKLRLELGLPPEPKSSSIRARYVKATEAGIIQSLEGKTPKEKEKILRGLADAGIPLPKARSPSEKALINKIKGEPQSFPKVTQSEKMRRARDAGLLTPLSGKSPSQIEKILQGRANLGIALPEGKTSSEKNIINKVRLDFGLPPEPTTPSTRERHERAAAAGILQPLEGKSSKEKKKILQGLADMDIPLPEGRTASEKVLIDEVKERKNLGLISARVPEPSITTQKLKQAKAAGLLTPLQTKSSKEKERILKELAKIGLPLPEGKTRSEKALINKIVKDYGIGKQPSLEKLRKAKAAGFLTPIEGKTPQQKEKILRGRAAAGLPLPKGKSPSEKDLINKIKASTGYVTPSPPELLEKTKAAGLLSPLEGKTPSEKEKYLRRIAAAGIPLPPGKTPSEKQLIKKVNEIEKSKFDKIQATKPTERLPTLKGKSPEQKEKILKELVKKGALLPEGTTPSEKALTDKIRKEMGLPPAPKSPTTKEKYEKAHAAGIITPLEGKTLPEKEKILRKLHDAGIPLPAGRTPSEKLLIKKAKGLSEPFEDLPTDKKEKILRGLLKSGETLPQATTSSTKELIKKVRKDMSLPPEPRTPSMKEKMRRAHSAGLITPLEGKTPAQKENIIRRLAEAGIPLPEARTLSEKAIKRKVESEMGKKFGKPTKEFKKHKGTIEGTDSRIQKAKEAGFETPLEGKSPEQKEKIVRGLAKLGLPLPEGITKSDKQLIRKVREDMGLPPSPETSSMRKRHDRAAAGGALVPLEGLTPSEKEKVLKSQAKLGLHVPEGRTPSEKSLITKIKEEKALSKVPPVKLQKAKDAGLLTPLKGKSHSEKEKILKGRAEAGLPLPEGRTISEKSLIKKIRAESRPAPTSKESGLLTPLTGKTSAEKEKILQGLIEAGLPLPEGKTSSERALIKKIKEENPKSKIDVLESKITKCERACGCDKKKIKFKHSYVKIRVTSPDISSLCPCPNECVPRVKGGVFVDNDGINVVIERVGTIPQYIPLRASREKKMSLPLPTYLGSEYNNYNDLLKSIYADHSLKSFLSDSQSSKTEFPLPSYSGANESRKHTQERITTSLNNMCLIRDNTDDPKSRAYNVFTYVSNTSTVMTTTSHDSFDSIIILKSETSISFSNSYEDLNTSSDSSFAASISTSETNSYILSVSNFDFNSSTIVKPEFVSKGDKRWTDANISSEVIIQSTLIASTDKSLLVDSNPMPEDVFQVSPMSSTKIIFEAETKPSTECEESVKDPVIIITNLNSDFDIKSLVDDLISKKEFGDASSLFVIVPSDEEENEICCAGLGCTQYIKISENGNKWQYGHEEPCWSCCRAPSQTQESNMTKRYNRLIEDLPTPVVASTDQKENNYNTTKHCPYWVTRNKICQITTPSALVQGCQVVSTDTTQDRPCCCGTQGFGACAANVMSNVITPVSINQGIKSNKSIPTTNNIQQASSVSLIQSPPTMSVDQISESRRYPDCQSEYIVEYPYSHSTQESRKDFNKLLHKNLSPHSMNKILIEMEQSKRRSNGSPIEFLPEENLLGSTPINENYLICHQHKSKKRKNPKWVSGDKALRIDDVCDCIHPHPSFIKTEEELELKNHSMTKQCCAVTPNKTKPFGQVISRFHRTPRPPVFKPDTLVSIGVQDSPGCILCLSGLPCTSEHKKCVHLSNTVIRQVPAYSHANHQSNLSPLRSYAAIGSGGIYTQRDIKHIRYNTDTGVGVDLKNTGTEKYTSEYSNKQVQKNSNVCFELPSQELAPKPRPIPQYMQDNERVEKNVILMKPNITQTASRVTYDDLMKPNITQTASSMIYDEKASLKPPMQPACTIEDIIRYYAIFKPDVLNTLISLTSIKKPGLKYKYEHNDELAQSSGVRHVAENRGFTKEPREQDSRYFTGFKIKKADTGYIDVTLPKKDITLQASFPSLPTISRCEILPCDRRQFCHSPDDLLIFPFGTPLSEPLLKLKKLLEENCSPDKVKYIFQLIEAGNVKDIDWDAAMRISPDPPGDDPAPLKSECKFPSCDGRPGCHSADEVLQYPFGTPLHPSLMKLKKLVEQNYDEKKVKDFFAQLEGRNVDKARCKMSVPKLNIMQSNDYQSSFSKPSVICRIPPCKDRSTCHSPDEVLQYPFGTPLTSELVELKNLIEEENCPEFVRKYFEELTTNKNNINCDTYLNNFTDFQSNAGPLTFSKTPGTTSQCITDTDVRDQQSQEYYLEHLSPHLAKLKTLLEQNDNSKPVKHLVEQLKTENWTKSNFEISKEKPELILPDNCLTSSPKTSTCHSLEEVLGYPYESPLPLHLKSLKNLLEQNHNPQKVRDLLRQIEAGELNNLDWSGAITKPNQETVNVRLPAHPNEFSTKPEPRTSICQDSSCSSFHSPNKAMDNGTYLPQFLLQLKKLFKPNYCDWVQAMKSPAEFSPNKFTTSESKRTISTCRVPPCQGLPGCHLPDQLLHYPFGTPLPQQLVEFKKLLEQNFDPKKVRQLFAEIEAGNIENLDLDTAMAILADDGPDDCTSTGSITSSGPCQIPPCGAKRLEQPLPQHLEQPLPQHLKELKELLEQCCSPETVRHLLKQIEAGNLKDFKSTGCGEELEIFTPLVCPPSVSTATESPDHTCLPPGALPPVVVVLPPEVFAPAPKDEDCSVCHKPKYRDGMRLLCACKKKTVKIKPPCPCEVHKAPISTEEPGLKISTRSIAGQCCICDEYSKLVKKSGQDVVFKLGQSAPSIIGTPGGPVSTGIQDGTGCLICPTGMPCSSEHSTCPKLTITSVKPFPVPLGFFGQPDINAQKGELEIIGPRGGYVVVGPDGIYTQAGIKQIRFSIAAATDPEFNNVDSEAASKSKKNCLCFGTSKKKRKIVCQCPSESDPEPLLLYTYEDFEEARKESKIFKSNLTQTTSGFKVKKKKQPIPPPEPDFMERAIRQYAKLKPDLLRELCPPGILTTIRKGRKKDCECEDDKSVDTYEIMKRDRKGNFVLEKEEPVPDPLEGLPKGGVKFTIGGKGSGSKGLTGICCFDMYQES